MSIVANALRGIDGPYQARRPTKLTRRDLPPGWFEYRLAVTPRPAKALEDAFTDASEPGCDGVQLHHGELIVEGPPDRLPDWQGRIDAALKWLARHSS
jgi:hypothetical protein